MNIETIIDYNNTSKVQISLEYIKNIKFHNNKVTKDLYKSFKQVNAYINKLIKKYKEIEETEENYSDKMFIMLDIRRLIHVVNYCYKKGINNPDLFIEAMYDNILWSLYDIENEILGLSITYFDIEEYFCDEAGYFEVKDHLRKLNTDDLSMFGLFENNDNYTIVVPPVTNLESALVNVHEIRHGLDLFNQIDPETVEELEKSAKDEEELFVKTYLRKQLNKNNIKSPYNK